MPALRVFWARLKKDFNARDAIRHTQYDIRTNDLTFGTDTGTFMYSIEEAMGTCYRERNSLSFPFYTDCITLFDVPKDE